MATTLYFRGASGVDYFGTRDQTNLAGADEVFRPWPLSTSRGAAATTHTCATVAGPTNGIEVRASGGPPSEWLSPPLAAAATISGSITWNLRAAENSMSANAAINAILEKVDGATGAVTLIDQTARTTELGTSEAAANFAETPAAGVSLAKGDRLRIRVFADDAGTMGSGFVVTFWFDGPTGGASGDSFVTLTETLSFGSAPAGTIIYPTNTASDVATASVDREAWTSRGGGVQTDVTNTTNGPVSDIQTTDTAGGTVVDWFTKRLQAMTLAGLCSVVLQASESAAGASANMVAEIAVVDADGTNPTVWASGGLARTDRYPECLTIEGQHSGFLAGDDLAISDGQRIRIRIYINDGGDSDSGSKVMVGGFSVTTYYAGASGGSGDCLLQFAGTLTEFVAATWSADQGAGTFQPDSLDLQLTDDPRLAA